MQNNWVPLNWAKAKQENKVFLTAKMATAHRTALKSYEFWRYADDETSRNQMISDAGSYLDAASSLKKELRSVPFSGLGVAWVLSLFRTSFYWLLIGLIFVVGIAAAGTEVFPANIVKPVQVILMDIFWEILEFVLILTHSYLPRSRVRFDRISALICFLVKVARAHVVGKGVDPPSPVHTFVDHFNAIAPALVAAAKAVFSITGKPITRLPHSAPGEPFESLVARGAGLNNQEREALMAVIITSPIPYRAMTVHQLGHGSSDSSTPSAVLSAMATSRRHYDAMMDMAGTIVFTAQALMVISGLEFSAIPDVSDGVWGLFQSPGPTSTAEVRQKYPLAAEHGLDHARTFSIVCELRDLGARLEELRMPHLLEGVLIARLVDPGWLASWRVVLQPPLKDEERESAWALVEKWGRVQEREEDLKVWQELVAGVIKRATDMLTGGVDVDEYSEDAMSPTLRRRR